MNQKMIARVTMALLALLVALPLLFIVLQAVFPHFSAGTFNDAFAGVPALLAEPQLPAMFSGTLHIATGVALLSMLIGLPLGIVRGYSMCRGQNCGICCF